ncbi:mannose-1-phosphate guanylyltransferase/mannose-6-phosphate isomerase [Thioalkalivibrio sp. HK1]|uniref:mannose-1-phosphate guanylyltransferase/mannose-6-phosphate isomerase n=1 Tax=Thioalkalivibrio sp. HK1 TaxID=1469245 RepID=UPI0004AE6AF2|nr:mannose-1-phosphate guanylyltransferase/mannose-6-phosphate isomerase [Thioalkalivibrio sp. HK1]
MSGPGGQSRTIDLLPVILAGGAGTRLWPLSRECLPKQFLRIAGQGTMLQNTLQRLGGIERALPAVIVCNEEHRFLAARQSREIEAQVASIFLEPAPKGTAPAVALVACQAQSRGEDPLLLVMPADHYIPQPAAFRKALQVALSAIEGSPESTSPAPGQGPLATFGVQPNRPDTNYGYIKAGRALGEAKSAPLSTPDERAPLMARRIERFVEKPDRATARSFVESGDFYWNSGIFVFRAAAFIAALDHHAPEIVSHCRKAVDSGERDSIFFRPGIEFERTPSDSIDCAVMEKSAQGIVIPLQSGWSDVGSWPSLHELEASDSDNNVLRGDVIAVDTRDSLVFAEHRLVTTLGLSGQLVVETADAVLVADLSEIDGLRKVVRCLREGSEESSPEAGSDDPSEPDHPQERMEHRYHRRVHRPWGFYESVERAQGYQVKRIRVDPGARLSMQMHRKRSEHWVVVRGRAEVVCDDIERTLSPDESIRIPVGARHRISNPGPDPLDLIEVQIGDYLGEDDIIRIEDDFGRVPKKNRK